MPRPITPPRPSLLAQAWGLVALAVALSTSLGSSAPAAAPAKPPQRVLLLYSDERLLPANIIMDEAIRAAFAAGSTNQLEYYSEFLDRARFPGELQERHQRDYLKEKYRDRPPDLVITVSGGALTFAVKYRTDVFAGAPVVHCAAQGDPHPVDLRDATVAEIPVPDCAAPTLELALRLQPDTRLVAVVLGSSPRDAQLAAIPTSVFSTFEQRVGFTWLTNRSLQQLRRELSTLPDHTVVFYLTMFQDAEGRSYTPRQALSQFADASRAPIYAYFDTYLGNGVVGGSMVTFEAIGRKTAHLAMRILAGEDPHTAAQAESHTPAPRLDWRQLRRWSIPEDRLPPGSQLLFRKPTLWEEHKDYVIGGLGIIVAQALTITLLLRQARRRKLAQRERQQAEQALAQQRNTLAHLSRVTTVSELSGSLAHELNQPLAIILTNAQAAQRLLAQPSPDLAEARDILADIVSEDQRAGEVIRRLRSLLKPGQSHLEPLSVNEMIEEVLRLTRSDLVGRGVTVHPALDGSVPQVSGDRIQLQQVLLNLILNGCDAMAANPPAGRHLTLTTARSDGAVRVSVSDTGCGLPLDADQIFEPFYTTKQQGLGLGLAICRSIIAAHKGRLWAQASPAGAPPAGSATGPGATFHVELPVAKEDRGYRSPAANH